MVARVVTVAFDGVEARRVDVEVQQVATPAGAFAIVGLPDKAVAESRERVRGAFAGIGLALPPKKVIANLAPADLPKEGSHFDLPIALALLASMGVIAPDALDGWAAVGELGLDGQIAAVGGTLPAAMAAGAMGLGLICPEANGPEAAWAGDTAILAPRSLIGLINHFRGTQILRAPEPGPVTAGERTSISPLIQNRALEWFTTNLLRLEDGSPRTLKAVAKFISYNPEEPRLWAKDMKAMLANRDQPDFIPPGGVMPRIFLDRTAVARLSLRRAA
jgi:hypothetical protein